LAFVDGRGRVTVVDADSHRLLWRDPTSTRTRTLRWSADGHRLLALASQSLRLFGAGGQRLRTIVSPPADEFLAAAFARSGHAFAVSRWNQRRNHSTVIQIGAGKNRLELFSGAGRFRELAWSPSGQWLLLTWPEADQWLFLRSATVGKVIAFSNISRQFAAGAGPVRFPQVEGWCCPP
jgi:hypothetical protein